MSLKKKAITSIVANYIGYFCAALLAFLVTPIIVHSLGKAQFGVWSLIMSVTGYYGLLNLGIRSALTKYIAEYSAKNDIAEVNRLISSSFPFFLGVAGIILLISYIVSSNFERMFFVDQIDLSIIRITVLLVGINVAISFALCPFDTILAAFNRFDVKNIIGVSSSIIRALSIITVLKLGYSLVAMAMVILVIDATTLCVIAICSRKIYPQLSIKLHFVCRESFRKLYTFGVFNFVRHISRAILSQTDLILIGIFLGATQVAVYAIAANLINYSWKIVKGVAIVTIPIASTLSALKEEKKLQRFMLLVPKYMMFIAVCICIQFFYFGKIFLLLWLGDGFQESYVIFLVLMVARIGMMSNESMIEATVGMGHNKFIGTLSAVEALINLILSIILVQKIGLLGIALGTVIPLIISRSFIIPTYCCKLVNLKVSDYISQVVWPTCVAILPCIIVTYAYQHAVDPLTYLGLAVGSVVSGLTAFGFYYRYLDTEIKEVILKKIRHLKHEKNI